MLDAIKARLSRWYYKREIAASVRHYRKSTGRKADRKQSYSDAGTFRSQVDRLFHLSSPAETGVCLELAQAVVSSCLTNKFYRPADFLSDIVTALETHTWLSPEPEGEPPIGESDDRARAFKLKKVQDAWLVPLKVASIEAVTAAHARAIGRALPYAAMARFERQAARFFSLLGGSEVVAMENRVLALLKTWKNSPGMRQRFPEPAKALAQVVEFQQGHLLPHDTSGLRVHSSRQPIRLSTVVQTSRSRLLEAAFASLGS